MLKLNHATLIFLSGLIWLSIGCVLLPLGLNSIISCLLIENSGNAHPFLNFLSPYAGGIEASALCIIASVLFVGYIKGTRIFAKSVVKTVSRICAYENPVSISVLYSPSYLLIVMTLCVFGFLLRFAPEDISGAVYIAMGSALIHGAMTHFRQALSIR